MNAIERLLTSVLPEWVMEPGQYHAFYSSTLFLIPLFPLIGFVINGLARKQISRGASGAVACLASALACAWSYLSFLACAGSMPEMVYTGPNQMAAQYEAARPLHGILGTWIDAGAFRCSFGLLMDQLSGVMALIVTGVGTLIHIYSLGYMSHDEGYARYFAYLNLFMFSMLVLILGDNLVLTFVGWEGVGLCSYLLIGFWYTDTEKAAAGMKAFVMNRIGDLGFLLGMFVLIAAFGTTDYLAPPRALGAKPAHEGKPVLKKLITPGKPPVDRLVMPPNPGLLDYAEGLLLLEGRGEPKRPLGYKDPSGRFDLSHTAGAKLFEDYTLGFAITLACLLIFAGACGKSAQLPLYAWLPDAMAGPTPVSALIHAATMVTAGVYMVVRLHPLYLFSPDAMAVVAVVGGLTAIFAAVIGLTQTDIKKVLAYSTVSQLGYMFLGAGLGAFWLAIFHVVTHAFFKALLFLGSGSVIHGMSGEQDMRKMGGLRTLMPTTFVTMLIGALALSGIFPLAGWWSKDPILANVLARAHESPTHSGLYYTLYVLAIAGAFCTAFYSFRLIGMTFFGDCRADEKTRQHIHESPPTMTLPLIALAILALVGGFAFSTSLNEFLNIKIRLQDADDHHVHLLNLVFTGLAGVGGAALALFIYAKKARVPQPDQSKNPLVGLSWNKFYLEWFYDKVVTTAFTIFAELLHLVVDVFLIDLVLVNGLGALARGLGGALRRLQSGLVNLYAAGILLGALAVMFYLLRG